MPKQPTKRSAEPAQDKKEAELLRQTISILDAANTLDSAFEEVLRAMCEAIGWTYGEVWIPHPGKAYLEVSPAWYASTPKMEVFRKRSEAIKFAPEIGLPGRAWTSAEAAW